MSVNIHGKDYITVAERVKEFRKLYPNYKMVDEIVNYNDSTITIKTSILNDNNETVATGFAREDREESKINETSYVENCETSAWGRALANLGIGVDSEIASAEEVTTAIKQQESKAETKPTDESKFYEISMNIADYDLSAIKDDFVRGKKQFAKLMQLVEAVGQDKEELGQWVQNTYGKKVIYLNVSDYLGVVQHVLDKNEPDVFKYEDIPFGA